MKKLIYMFSLLAAVLVFSSFTDGVMAKKDKKEKAKTEKVTKAKKEKKSKKKKADKKKGKKKKVLVETSISNPVWVFGFSASFTDSLVYMTDIQLIPDAKVKKKTKFLENSVDYAYQMKMHLEENLNLTNRTCVIFYGLKKEQAEKKLVEIRKRYTGQTHLTIKYLSASEFKFEPIKEEE